jgi:hypothetical protein
LNSGSWGRTFAKAALLFGSIGFSFLICELLLRGLGYAAIYEVYSKPELLWKHDDLLGWSHQPNSTGDYIGPRPWPIEFESHVQINSLGLNGPELAPLPENGVRILFLGDSMVAGFEVEYEETFCARLGEMLSRRLGRPVQVVNAGVRGYGTDQAYLYFRDRGQKLQPDVVVHWLSENDLLDDITIHRMRRMFGKPAFIEDGEGRLELVASPVPSYPECSEYRIDENREIVRVDTLPGRMLCGLQLALFDRSALFSFVTTLLTSDRWGRLVRDLYYLGMPDPTLSPDEGQRSESTPITHHLLRRMAEEVGGAGAQFALVGPPSVFRYFADAGVDLDPTTILTLDEIESADPKLIQFKHDSHYTAAGHRIVADQLTDLLAPIVENVERRAH